ncbi:MAG: metallophosphoesterase [Clostridia bacterium]|nr:metallophosphoesterase [Clostridia bacterium]
MIYVTSDLHGYPVEKFNRFLGATGFGDDDFCFILGDVIDRGPESVELLRWLLVQPNVQLLRGNHEQMMLDCFFLFDEITDEAIARLENGYIYDYMMWMRNGGESTVEGLRRAHPSLRADILEYLKATRLFETVHAGGRDFLLTHAGLGHFSPEKHINDYTPGDLLWNRPAPDDRYRDDIMTVFGHTPTGYLGGPAARGRAIVTDTWIDIDTGAAGGGDPMLLRLDDLKEFYVSEVLGE